MSRKKVEDYLPLKMEYIIQAYSDSSIRGTGWFKKGDTFKTKEDAERMAAEYTQALNESHRVVEYNPSQPDVITQSLEDRHSDDRSVIEREIKLAEQAAGKSEDERSEAEKKAFARRGTTPTTYTIGDEEYKGTLKTYSQRVQMEREKFKKSETKRFISTFTELQRESKERSAAEQIAPSSQPFTRAEYAAQTFQKLGYDTVTSPYESRAFKDNQQVIIQQNADVIITGRASTAKVSPGFSSQLGTGKMEVNPIDRARAAINKAPWESTMTAVGNLGKEVFGPGLIGKDKTGKDLLLPGLSITAGKFAMGAESVLAGTANYGKNVFREPIFDKERNYLFNPIGRVAADVAKVGETVASAPSYIYKNPLGSATIAATVGEGLIQKVTTEPAQIAGELVLFGGATKIGGTILKATKIKYGKFKVEGLGKKVDIHTSTFLEEPMVQRARIPTMEYAGTIGGEKFITVGSGEALIRKGFSEQKIGGAFKFETYFEGDVGPKTFGKKLEKTGRLDINYESTSTLEYLSGTGVRGSYRYGSPTVKPQILISKDAPNTLVGSIFKNEKHTQNQIISHELLHHTMPQWGEAEVYGAMTKAKFPEGPYMTDVALKGQAVRRGETFKGFAQSESITKLKGGKTVSQKFITPYMGVDIVEGEFYKTLAFGGSFIGGKGGKITPIYGQATILSKEAEMVHVTQRVKYEKLVAFEKQVSSKSIKKSLPKKQVAVLPLGINIPITPIFKIKPGIKKGLRSESIIANEFLGQLERSVKTAKISRIKSRGLYAPLSRSRIRTSGISRSRNLINTRGLTNTRGLSETRDLSEIRPIVETRGISDIRPIVDTRGITDTRAITDTRSLLELRSITDTRPFTETPPPPPPPPPPGFIIPKFPTRDIFKKRKKSKDNTRRYMGTPTLNVVLGGMGIKLTKSQVKGKSFINPFQTRRL